ncbi:MAG TPA: hypothetical protein VK875_05755 [Euzebyales bacterium]|nr:hypothetical protein [Euzebyales bacterium]
MATEHFEDDIELDDEIEEGEDLDLNVLDDEEVEYSDDVYEEDDDEDDADVAVEGAGTDEDDEEEEEEEEVEDPTVVEEDEEDDIVDDDEDEEEDEETLEVLLGPDNEATVTPLRSRKDDSGDAPPGEGEFTCRSCFLVKRRAQLADADAMICLDCA